MSCVAAPIPATDVSYDGVRLLDLDLERGNERILGLDENVIALPFDFQADSELRRHLPPSNPGTGIILLRFTRRDKSFLASPHRRAGRFRLSTLEWLGGPRCAKVWTALPELTRQFVKTGPV